MEGETLADLISEYLHCWQDKINNLNLQWKTLKRIFSVALTSTPLRDHGIKITTISSIKWPLSTLKKAD